MKIPRAGRYRPAQRFRVKEKEWPGTSADPDSIVITKINWKGRKVPLSYSGHVCGWHPVRPGHGSIQFESLIERNTITALARSPWVKKIVSQPLTVEYQLDGNKYSYTPDFAVQASAVPEKVAALGFGSETYIECKPYDLVEKQFTRMERHFSALRMALGLPVVLITDRDLISGVLESANG